MKQNENKTATPLKVTQAIQQKITLNINKVTMEEIKRTSEEISENKKPLFFLWKIKKPLSRLTQKQFAYIVIL